MMKLAILILLSVSLSSRTYAEDAPLCANDLDGDKRAQSQAINMSIERSNDPLMRSFLNYEAEIQKQCEDQNIKGRPLFSQAISLIRELAPTFSISPATYIKKACVQASLQRKILQKGYACNNGRAENIGTNRREQCLSQKYVDFVHYSVNLALKCFASIDTALDARVILKKINTETGFNFFFSYNGGTGIGQLISYPPRDIAGTGRGEGNARFVLEEIANSKDPACEPFQHIARNDLATPPPLYPARNVCAWVAADTGFARNLMYSFGYYLHVRENYVKRTLRSRAPELVKNREVVSYLTLLGYGPDGPNGATSFIRNRRLNSRSNPDTVINQAKQDPYVRAAEQRMQQLLKKKEPGKSSFSATEKRGDTCVAH